MMGFPLPPPLRRPTKAGTLMRKRELRDNDDSGDGDAFGCRCCCCCCWCWARRIGFNGLPTAGIVDVETRAVADVGESVGVGVTGEIAITLPPLLYPLRPGEDVVGVKGISRTDAANSNPDCVCCLLSTSPPCSPSRPPSPSRLWARRFWRRRCHHRMENITSRYAVNATGGAMAAASIELQY